LSTRGSIRHFCRERRGAVTLEFAITATIFLTVVLGAVDLGLLCWTRNGLQLIAAMTARCAALGSCSDPASYATTMAESWVASGTIIKSNVSYNISSQCYSSQGTYNKFDMVTITSSFWAWLPPPLSNVSLQVSACYPVPS
jgi:Flp pilus assembly protein TadG